MAGRAPYEVSKAGIPRKRSRSASLVRIFTHTSRPAALMCRCRWEGQRGHSPSPAPAGDPRSVAPKGRLAPRP